MNTSIPAISSEWRYHFLGAGGIGMSALALELHRRGIAVSGSDAHSSTVLDALAAAGIPVQVGHHRKLLENAQAVVFSSALKPNHPVWQEVAKLGLAKFHRSEMLAALTQGKRLLAVTGTHGKTTSTAILACALEACGTDPLVFLGGELAGWAGSGNLRPGQGTFCICEADESDGSLVKLSPQGILLTNIDADHLDVHGSLESLQNVLQTFVQRLSADGILAYCSNDTRSVALAGKLPPFIQQVSFGQGNNADVSLKWKPLATGGMHLTLAMGDEHYQLHSPLLGQHNAFNLAGAFALARSLQLPAEKLIAGLEAFGGVRRRQERLGTLDNLLLMDDYAHHPTEIQATLQSIKGLHEGPLVVVFQPHLYSRTRQLSKEFAQALSLADEVLLTPIYAAREEPIPGVSSADIARYMTPKPQLLKHWKDLLPQLLQGRWTKGLMITLGAGDITELGRMALKQAAAADNPAACETSNSKSSSYLPTTSDESSGTQPIWGKSLQETLQHSTLRWNESLAAKTSLKVGGPAKCLAEINSKEDLHALMQWLKKHRQAWWVMGKGSNLLVKDEGLDGVAVRLGKALQAISITGNCVHAGAGLSNAAFVEKCRAAHLGGVEFLSVIPGSIGGAVFMNAGAHGSETASFLSRVWLCHTGGQIEVWQANKSPAGIPAVSASPTGFGYRSSPFKRGAIIYAVEFNLQPTAPAEARRRQKDMLAWRKHHHPKGANCGSVFKNPPGHTAAQLIDQAGLKGLTIGGAQVSTQHANFIINTNKASASDILQLIQKVQQQVLQHSGIQLELEVQILP